MKIYDRTSVYEFLGDLVVYRNLVPADPRLPPLAEIRPQIGLPQGLIPRKSAPEYAQVIVHLLRQARALDAPSTPLERLIYLGDTRLNDGTAFTNICRAGDWPGLAFIGTEKPEPAQAEIVRQEVGTLYLANRWAALADFERFCREQGCPPDERTAVIVDLDKTALGARGRNDHVIDRARVEAVRRTVGGLLGDDFDPQSFQVAYNRLNQPEFHPFTADNQDYLAYICLILGSGLYSLEPLVEEVRAGRMRSFAQFIAEVESRADELPTHLRHIHSSVYALAQQGDPTPFKAFRYNEYQTTVGRMGYLEDSTPVERLLREEIVITQEVREIALHWREQGALLFGLSDKPDEASVPTEDLASQGYEAIHRTETHAVGG
ncbi:MAG: hypothetical protein H5T62_13105 [Anaerolineae bacterium]|nr:hypothetical protein [Anaerolineae bacterium]